MKKNGPKKILITGGAGFIGSNFVRHIYKKYPNYEIHNLDLLAYSGHLHSLEDISAPEESKPLNKRRYFFIKGDICDFDIIDDLFKKHKFDFVVNFAAESHVDRSIINDHHFIRTNLLGTHNLIGLVKKHEIPRFIHISTDEIYGDVAKRFSHEFSPIRPSNPYSASKASADILVQAYMRTHKLPMLIVRGSNNFGPYQYPEKLIPISVTNILENKRIPIHGDGRQIRSWIHVYDFCEGVDLAMQKGKDFEIYNIGGIQKRNIDLIKEICRILDVNFKDSVNFIKDRPGGDRRYAIDASKIKRELGWQLKYPIDDYLEPVVKWYVYNRDWWSKIRNTDEFKIFYEKQHKSEY